jgi:tetratricopeptide (TPR) repeat protein
MRNIRLLRTQARARIGDSAGAAEVIDESGGVQQLLADLGNGRISPSAALGIGTVLRDADRLDDALALAEQLQRSVSDESHVIAVHNFAATVLENTGDLHGAAKHSRAALKLAKRGSPKIVAEIAGNLAMNYLLQGKPRRALDLVDDHPPSPDAQQPTLYALHAIRGEALLDLGDNAGAQRELTAALAIQDETRGHLRAYEDRMTWHAKQLKVHEDAVLAATLNLDWSAALDLVERFKARAFVDQLAAAQLPPIAEPSDLREVLNRIQARRRLLRRLSVSAQAGYVDHDLLRQLSELGSGMDLADQGDDDTQGVKVDRFASELSREDVRAARLEAEIENARLAAVESIVGTTLSYDEVRNLLGRGHQAA